MLIEEFDQSKLLDIVVRLSPISAEEARRLTLTSHRQESSTGRSGSDDEEADGEGRHPLSMTPAECCYCLDDVGQQPHVRCLECLNFETILCLKCFRLGAESGEHRRGHNYELVDRKGPNLFDNLSGADAWGCQEDLGMLSSFINGRLLQWWEKDELLQAGRQRTVQEALQRLDRCFLRSNFGDYILDVMRREPLRLAEDDTFAGASETLLATLRLNVEDEFERQLAFFHDPFIGGCGGVDGRPIESEDDIGELQQNSTKTRTSDMLVRSSRPSTSQADTPRTHKSPQATTRQTLRQSANGNANSYECDLMDNELTSLNCRTKRRKLESPTQRQDDGTPPSLNASVAALSPPIRRRPPQSVDKRVGGRSKQRRMISEEDSGGREDAAEPTVASNGSDEDGMNVDVLPAKYLNNDEDGENDDKTETNGGGAMPAAERIMSRRLSAEFRANRREMLENAKAVASEVMRRTSGSARMRKSSLELSEALNVDDVVANRLLHKSSDIMSEERLLELRVKYPDSYFFTHPPKQISREALARYDPDDLQIIGYMPMRDDYEHEYKHKAENLVSQLVFRRPIENAAKSDVEKFADVVKLACIQRYNRVLKCRVAKRGVIVEHDLINEFLQVAKNNLSERGKYNVFDEKYFNSKRKEEDYKPLFCKLRQVADRPTVNQLARNVGKMVTLMDQIEELKQMQQAGIKTLKGKLKVDTVPPCWSKKRRSRKTDSLEVKKANARWKRIIRWSKRQPDIEEAYDEQVDDDMD